MNRFVAFFLAGAMALSFTGCKTTCPCEKKLVEASYCVDMDGDGYSTTLEEGRANLASLSEEIARAKASYLSPFECKENDNGDDLSTYGEAIGYSISPLYIGEVVTFSDECLMCGSLYERYCEDVDELMKYLEGQEGGEIFLGTVLFYKERGIKKLLSWKEIECPSGCENGACK